MKCLEEAYIDIDTLKETKKYGKKILKSISYSICGYSYSSFVTKEGKYYNVHTLCWETTKDEELNTLDYQTTEPPTHKELLERIFAFFIWERLTSRKCVANVNVEIKFDKFE